MSGDWSSDVCSSDLRQSCGERADDFCADAAASGDERKIFVVTRSGEGTAETGGEEERPEWWRSVARRVRQFAGGAQESGAPEKSCRGEEVRHAGSFIGELECEDLVSGDGAR